MRLFMIKRKIDRKFFVGINGHYMLHARVDGQSWSDRPGVFFRTPDGIAANLRRLCSEPYWDTEAPEGVSPRVAVGWCELGWRNFDESKLGPYEIVTMDVDILSMKAMPATEFVQMDTIRSIPLNTFERRTA